MDKVRETLLKIFNAIKERWQAIGKTTKVILFSVVGAVVVAIIVLTIIFNQTGYTVLYADITTEEMQEIATILQNELSIADVKISGNQILVPDQYIDSVHMEMAIRGYPKSNWNYDIWNNGVGMFSTETEKNEIMRQQASENLSAKLNTLNPVNYSRVSITSTDTQTYVLEANRQDVKVSIVLVLKDGEKLKSDQIEGIYKLVETSVPGLKRENIGIVDQSGVTLTASDSPSELESLAIEERRMYIQNEFNRTLAAQFKADLNDLFINSFRDFNISVNAELDFGTTVSESTEYSGTNVDEDGNQTGIVSESINKAAAGGVAAEGGVIGTTVNADISPDFPTLEAQAGSDVFYESVAEMYYKVNEIKTQYQSSAYTVKNISCAVFFDEAVMSQQEIDEFRLLIANALGTSMDLVSVMARPFTLRPNVQDSTTNLLPTTNRNTLIFIIIALGALLIILFFLAIMTSGSKKKRHVRSRLVAATAAAAPTGRGGGAGYEDGDMFGQVTATKVAGMEGPEDFGITSLLAEEGESRETVLKGEIREFARTNPDIVAQLIRTWMKE